jgi:hypothetical protein
MSAEVPPPDVDNPEFVHWSPRRGVTVGDGPGLSVYILALIGAAAVGAVAVGAVAIGALAVGQLVVGRGRVRDLRIGRLEVGDLLVKRRAIRPF